MSEKKVVVVTEQSSKDKHYVKKGYWGTGRRKSAVARVRVIPGKGSMIVNGRDAMAFFQRQNLVMRAWEPLKFLDLESQYDIYVNLMGGGLSGAADAVRLGIARALEELNPEFRKKLKPEGLLSRDPRVKERKKYGNKRARKGFQYRKR